MLPNEKITRPMTAAQLRYIRHKWELSAAEFARFVGVAEPRTVRRWESGETPIPGTVIRLVNLLLACEPAREEIGLENGHNF